MVNTIYTIGYSGFKIESFIETIKSYSISLVVDVRSKPYSTYFSDFNKETIKEKLEKQGVYYRNYACEFGARQEDINFYEHTYMDFEKFAKSDQFLSGFSKLVKAMEANYSFVLMCAEKDPVNCHRAILVARAFYEQGYIVKHIMSNGSIITQHDIEIRLLEHYFPNRAQLSLIEKPMTDQELIVEAYRKRNADIGYALQEE
ncbi:MAG: DUF488 domain-containing protein [Clostridiaceae bacterium]